MLLGEDATEEDVANLHRIYGFDRPLHEQYFRWAKNVLQGDFGTSIRQVRPSLNWFFRESCNAGVGLCIRSYCRILGIPLGVFAAVNRGTIWDYLSMIIALIGVSMPSFWLGLFFYHEWPYT